jgi:adenylate cyclase class 2
METEYEATFANINKDEIRNKLSTVGAKLVRPEFMQRRKVFNMPKGLEDKEAWMRVRDEGNRVTMSYKKIGGKAIDEQKETMLVIDDFDAGVEILEKLGCIKKAFQESKRELWELDGVEITIDEWPFLEPYIEVEGKSEEAVRKVSEKLGFDFKEAIFDSVDYLYSQKYGVSKDEINNKTPEILFGEKNPFLR